MSFNLADLFERVVDAVPDRLAIVAGDRRLSYAALDERANRLAHALGDLGVRAGDAVGLMLLNGTEYVEGMLAAFKLRAVPINVNYRYRAAELRFLFDDADLVALVCHRGFTDEACEAAATLPRLRTLVVVEDPVGHPPSEEAPEPERTGPGRAGSAFLRVLDYEPLLSGSSPERPAVPGRSGDDRYCVYTGGTTGSPKGVVWRHEDIFFASLGGGDPFQLGNVIRDPDELPGRIPSKGLVTFPTAPLMHVSAHWVVFATLYGGGTVVLSPTGRFDPVTTWQVVGAERVNTLVIVGDAMARPLLDAYEAAPAGSIDTSSLYVVGSGGALLSEATKQRFARLLPSVAVVDGFGASETGVAGTSLGGPSGATRRSRFSVDESTTVLDDHLRPVEPGSGVVGRLARRGHIPLGYHKDPERTAKAFVEVDGVRYVLPGDMATVEADGTVVVLGRGSECINTGGEKVYPEEVEAALKAHPAVADAVVVGHPDDHWGERVVAVVEPRPGAHVTLEELRATLRAHLAGYKLPRDLVLVDHVVRSPAGKPDYHWAKAVVASELSGRPSASAHARPGS